MQSKRNAARAIFTVFAVATVAIAAAASVIYLSQQSANAFNFMKPMTARSDDGFVALDFDFDDVKAVTKVGRRKEDDEEDDIDIRAMKETMKEEVVLIAKKKKAHERVFDRDIALLYVSSTDNVSVTAVDDYFIYCNSSASSDKELDISVSGFSGSSGDSDSTTYTYNTRNDVKHIVDAIHSASLNREPFKSSYFCNVLPDDLYNDMSKYFPPAHELLRDARANAGQVGRRDADKRFKCSAFDILKLRDQKKWPNVLKAKKVWERATKALYAPSVKLALFTKFRISKKPMSRDFRVQSDMSGFSIGTHPDNRKKILTFQLYIPQDQNDENSVYTYGTCLHTQEHHKNRNKIDGHAPCEKKMAFLANSAYAFPVTRSSFHSVEKVAKTKGVRKTVMLNWYSYVMEGAQSMGTGLLDILG